MKLKVHHKLELTGLLIVLVATTFQLMLVTKVDSISNQAAFLRIEEKINTIWFEITDPSKNYDQRSVREQDFDYWTGSGEEINKEADWFNTAYAVIMLAGSALLVSGRWLEVKNGQV